VPASTQTVQTLGEQLREVLPSRRLHSVSLCDHEANVLWLSEGALGPDEHGVVVEALEALTGDPALPCHEAPLEDGRLAVFLPVRAPTGALVGIAMILADSKSVGDDTLERLTAAPVRTIMQRLAVLLKPAAPAAAHHDPIPIELTLEPEVAPAAPASAAAPNPAGQKLAAVRPIPSGKAAAAAPAAPAVMSPEQVNEMLELAPAEELTNSAPSLELAKEDSSSMVRLEFLPDPPVAAHAAPVARTGAAPPTVRKARVLDPPTQPRPVASTKPAAAPTPPAVASLARAPTPVPAPAPAQAADSGGVILELLPFAKLRAGGQSRRFQLQARTTQPQRDPVALDALVLQRLLGWLAQHRATWNAQPTSFTVNLSIATLEDERFVPKLAQHLNANGIAAETLGFEIAEALCAQRRAPVERFITQCEKVGAWVAIDDFTFDAQVLPLMRCKALRLIKLDAKLTTAALRDKLSQALVVASVQAAKVLGIHCAAKKVDSKASLQWLTAIGCDFAQGDALAPVQPLESLGALPPPAPAPGG
jgi:EAL domain-containing protein (putative c-di-GMP-specific phosphodiesterase class I)